MAKRQADRRAGRAIGGATGRDRRVVVFGLLCLLGLLLSADLLRLHVRVHTDPGESSYCVVSEQLDCDAVAASPWSVFGGLPLALWGCVGYATMGGLAWWGAPPRSRGAGLAVATGLAVASALAGLALFYVSHFVIGSVCLVCAATYVVNAGLVVAGLLALRRAKTGLVRPIVESLRTAPRHAPGWGVGLAVAAAALLVLRVTVPPYWRVEVRTGPGGVPVGVTKDGHPWIGAVQPRLGVVEFSDYECPHCRDRHAELRRRIEQHPDGLRLVHRHYPLDQACNPAVRLPFHQRACEYARLAWCAQAAGKFWEANDRLFAAHDAHETVTAASLAATLGLDPVALEACVAGAEAADAIGADIAAGRAVGVSGTPAFLVDGRLYPAVVPEEVLRRAED